VAQQTEVDLLVNNAAQGDTSEFVRSDEARLARLVQLNDVAPVLLTRRLLPEMLARGRGGVINVASTVGFYPVPFMANYGASKAFLLSYSLALAEEVAGSPLRVLALCPGPMRTRFQQNAGYQLGRLEKLAELEPERVASIALRAYARGKRLCSPGLLNALQAFVSRLVPLTWLSRLVGSVMRSLGRHETRS
jgi:short-subunit dehydrogenase